jgi:hypothetical protein
MPILTRKLTVADAMKIEIRNPVEKSTGAVDCEINHPGLGKWISYTAAPDGDPAMQVIHTRAFGMGPVPYVPPPPTKEQLVAEARRQREQAYRRQADPLFFEAEAGEIERQAWLDKRAEIKKRFPMPDAKAKGKP